MGIFDFFRPGPAQQDVSNFISDPNLNSALGIAGTIFNVPEFNVSEAQASEPTSTYSAPAPAPSSGNVTGGYPSVDPNLGGGTVLGDATTSGGGGGFDMSLYPGWNELEARADFEATGGPNSGGDGGGGIDYGAQIRSDIESGYGDYFAQLDAMMNEGLPAQQAARTGIIESQFGDAERRLGSQRDEGFGLLDKQRERTGKNQVSTLRDLSSNIRNMFQAGNVFLGARGAGDSSAAGQYAHALTKLGSRGRSDVMRQSADIMSQIDDRESKLQNIYTEEIGNQASTRDQNILALTEWFAEQQNSLRLAKGEGSLRKGQDLASLSQTLLTNAMNQLNSIDQDSRDRRSALDQWALNNSNTIAELRTNMQQVSNFNPTQPGVPQIAGMPQSDAAGNLTTRVGGGGGATQDDEQNRLFGQATA